MDTIDHKDLAESRLATQFKESVNLIAYIRTILEQSDQLEAMFHQLLNDRWLDTAIGAQLDIIGAIVGQPRIAIEASLVDYFGFAPYLISNPFGSLATPGTGGVFRSYLDPSTGSRLLSDSEYRLFIRSRITKNSTLSTIQEVIDAAKFITGAPEVQVVEGTTSYTVRIGRILSNNEKLFFFTSGLIPKTAGVTVNYEDYQP